MALIFKQGDLSLMENYRAVVKISAVNKKNRATASAASKANTAANPATARLEPQAGDIWHIPVQVPISRTTIQVYNVMVLF